MWTEHSNPIYIGRLLRAANQEPLDQFDQTTPIHLVLFFFLKKILQVQTNLMITVSTITNMK